MSTKRGAVDGSPSASTVSLAHQHSRRGSISSLASTSKETISHALDQINQQASRTGTLTTFNEYTSPPPSSSGGDGKGLAGELQGGLTGLYGRLRASVGNVRDIVTHNLESGGSDERSMKSPKLPPPSPSSVTHSKAYQSRSSSQILQSATTESMKSPNGDPSKSREVRLGDLTSTSATLQKGLSTTKQEGKDVLAKASHGQMTKPNQLSLGASMSQIKPALTPSLPLPLKSPLAPLAPPTTVVSPAVAEANVNDGRDHLQPSKAEEQLNETFNRQKAPSPSDQFTHLDAVRRADKYSRMVAEPTSEAAQKVQSESEGIGVDGQANADACQNRDVDYFTTAEQPMQLPRIVTHPGTPQTVHSRTPTISSLRKNDRNDHAATELCELDEREVAAPSTPRSQYSHEQKKKEATSSRATSEHSKLPSSKWQDFDSLSKSTVPQIRNKVLSKDFWMKDDNARDCFYCGDSFSTFRRKHHCRTCGQIFDAKCTSILPGAPLGHTGSIRVCKPCEGIINGYDDSSEFSDDSSIRPPSLRPRHGSTGASDALGSPGARTRPGSLHSMRQSPKHSELTAPTMSIPATRKPKSDSGRNPTVLEIEGERTLTRPSSSRSLKSRPFTPSHRRHNSRHLHQRSFKALPEDSAPFHRNIPEEKPQRLPAFHDDNIIDPDLAPYLSDEASSGDEQIGIVAAMHGEGTSRSLDEKTALAGYLNASKKGHSRAGGDRSSVTFASRVVDADTHSLSSSRAPTRSSRTPTRSSRRRNLSNVANVHMRPSPRAYRMSAAVPPSNANLHESFSSSALAQMMSTSSAPAAGPRMIRSSSMRGAAAPAVELNSASLQHVRKLLRQLLQDSHVSSVGSWEKALVPILLQATDDVNPDMQNGDDIDIRHYVKLKKIPRGTPDDTSYVSGLVFTKNLALKSMPRSIVQPRILILTFPIEYSRHQQHFMSLEPVIRQEREYLENLVHRIAALQPNLLLVERNVSGMALEFLEKANIATAYNVKASVLEAVSRCSQTRILSSIDKLAIKPPQAGTCESFYLKTYQHGGQRKTYTFLSGCAKELGCTIVLRGADNATMAKVKRITEFMVYVVYNLKLETCLMRDEFALIPSATQTGTLTPGQRSAPEAAKAARADPAPPSGTVAEASNDVRNPHLAIKETSADVANADVMKTTDLTFSEFKDCTAMHPEEATVPEDVPMPSFYSDMVEEHRTKILSASPFVKFMQPYLLMRSREQERRLAYLRRLRDLDVAESGKLRDEAEPEVFQLINPEMVHERVRTASKSVREVLQAVHDTEYDKALHNYQVQSKQWETYISGNINLFDPEAHQNIAVLYSVVCTATTVPCSGPDLLALGFYNEHETDQDFEADCTLGQYVEDLCFGANTSCTANSCERKMFEHHRQYVHGEAQISVFVERYPCKLRGLQNTILMWSCCRVCGTETQVMPMSGSTWKYSFGKYLELSFWSKDIHARADICPHDLHREHLRYFGFKDLALRVQYDPITLLEVIVPRARITWKVDNDLRFKNDLYVKHETRINRFMLSVKARLKSILVDSVVPEKMEACKNEVNRLMERSREDHRTLVRNLQDRYMTSRHYETVPFNRAIRATQEKVAEWDNAFADFDRNYFPSEKDIRRLATLQLKKIFLDRDDTSASLTSNEEGTVPAAPDKLTVVTSSLEEQPSLVPQTRNMSPEKTQDMLSAVVDKDVASQNVAVPFASINEQRSAPPTAVPKNLADKTTSDPAATDHEDVRHLDLAMSSKLKEQSAAKAARPDGEPRAIDFATRTPRLEQVRAAQQAKEGGNIPTVEPEQEGGEPRKLPTILLQDPSQEPMKAKSNQPSGIPRPTEGSRRQKGINMSPAIHRTHSQPVQHQRDWSNSSRQSLSHPEEAKHEGSEGDDSSTTNEASAKPAEKKLSDRMGLSTLKLSGVAGHSMIPRSIVTRKDSHVSTLAKHFEQLSREFEKERLRERRQRFSKSRQARAYPMAAAKPIVEIYKNVREAVEERDPSDEDLLVAEPLAESGELPATVDQMAQMEGSRTSGEGVPNEDTTADNTETEENTLHSHVGSDTDGEAHRNDVDHVKLEEVPGSPSEHHALSPTEAQMDLKLDLPKHEKTSLMKTLTNFWAERSASGWQALDYPLNAYDHIFADSDIIVREDEPSSLIAFALGSEDYKAKLQDITSRTAADDPDGGDQEEMQRTMTRTTGTHLKYQFQEGSAKMLCKVFYAEQFEAVRRKCGVSERITESLSRCMKWDSKGGKTKSVFLKTLDDRFVLKSLPPGETQTFLRFAPAYFQLMSECLFQGLPSVIAKMVGFYQIIIKNPLTGVDFNWYLIVMENLFYDRSPTRIFDLKGSMRNRRIQSTGEQNEVLLDENMVDFIYESPLFAREHSKKLLRASVWNDTLFLARQNVMDYSLMIAIDEERQELVVGIIDVIRTYTWDKKLEFWFKDKGSRSRPTVTSPRDYKNRFREAMGRYVLQAPNCWHQFHALQLETKVLKMERDGDGEAHQQV